jgi:hypothetical protein
MTVFRQELKPGSDSMVLLGKVGIFKSFQKDGTALAKQRPTTNWERTRG